MIDERYYKGYEGEIEVVIYSGDKKGLKVWEGYFENLLLGCFNGKIKQNGLLSCWQKRDGFYDEHPWKIPNIELAIGELRQFAEDRVETDSPQMISSLKQLKENLLVLLQESKNKKLDVYIDYN